MFPLIPSYLMKGLLTFIPLLERKPRGLLTQSAGHSRNPTMIFITGQTRVKEVSIRHGVFSVVSNGVLLTRGLSEGSWKYMSERKNINSLIILVP